MNLRIKEINSRLLNSIERINGKFFLGDFYKSLVLFWLKGMEDIGYGFMVGIV